MSARVFLDTVSYPFPLRPGWMEKVVEMKFTAVGNDSQNASTIGAVRRYTSGNPYE